MSWSPDDNPWSQPRKPTDRSHAAPPSFEKTVEEWCHKLKGFNGGKPTKPAGFMLALVVVGWVLSGVYTVKEAEQAVVLRFGAYLKTVGSGLRYHLPYPFEEAIKRNVAANNYLSSDQRGNLVQREQADFYMLTGDENLVELGEYTILWRIKDLKKFLFNVRATQEVILAAADSSLREVIAKTPINLIITERRAQVNEEVTQLLQELLDHYDSGIQVVEFLMQKADPPEPVLDAFLDVTRAEADRERAQHEARAYRDEILPKARSVATKMLLESEGYAKGIISKSEGEAGRFAFLMQEYSKSPETTRMRLYTETMEKILRSAQKVIIDTPHDAGALHPYMSLDALKPGGKRDASPDKPKGSQPADNGGAQ